MTDSRRGDARDDEPTEDVATDAPTHARPKPALPPTVRDTISRKPEIVAPGARFGRFVVTGLLGQGGMGVVLAAHDPELEREVAVKVLRPSAVAAVDELQREAQAMARISHPNTIKVFEVGRADEQTFIVMELVDGATLSAWLAAEERPWRAIVEMYLAAGRGLAAAHAAELVHRDFKPENVLVDQDGRPRVGDFGLVTSAAETPVGFAGTPPYMAPEQWSSGDVDARTDQFAFCVALWRALYRTPPYGNDEGTNLRAAVLAGKLREPDDTSNVPRWVQRALRRGLARDPADRWPALDELLDALRDGLAASRHRRTLAIAAALAVTAAAAILALAVIRRPEPDEPRTQPVMALTALRTLAAQARAANDLASESAAWVAVFKLTGDPLVLLEQLRTVHRAGRCRQTIQIADAFEKALGPHPQVPSEVWRELSSARRECEQPFMQTDNVAELERMVDQYFRNGDDELAIAALERMRTLTRDPDERARYMKRIGDIEFDRGHCDACRKAFETYFVEEPHVSPEEVEHIRKQGRACEAHWKANYPGEPLPTP